MFCPNKDCRDYQLTGFHADFVDGVSECPTCGASLVEALAPDDHAPEENAERGDDIAHMRGLQIDLEPVIETADHNEIILIRSLLDTRWIPHVLRAWNQMSDFERVRSSFDYQPAEGAFVFLVPTGLAEEARSVLDGIDDLE